MEEKGLQKKYGLATAVAMVIGIVIGSGVFFKAEKILQATGGDLGEGILSWIIGGIIMVVCAYVFATLATRHEKVNGVVDYAEDMVGTKYGYFIGWFFAVIYFPTLTSVLAWVSARYFGVLMGWDIVGGETMTLAAFFLIAVFCMNTLSPKIAGKFQVSTTVIKLIPLFLMAVLGTIAGLHSGILVENFSQAAVTTTSSQHPLFTAVVATSFAYEGWIIATSINSELKDAKKNLPKALTFGTLFIVLTYVLYYIGLAGTVENAVMMKNGEQGAKIAFMSVFSNIGGTVLFVFVVISCLGTLNGLMMGCVRGLYALAARNMGPNPATFKQVDTRTDMPVNACVMGLGLAALWLLYFYGANLVKVPWFGWFSFDSSELPIVTIYAMYIPIFVQMMRKEKDLGSIRRYVMPFFAICCCLFMVVAAFYAHSKSMAGYLIIFAVIMICGAVFNRAGKH
ncbi:MAG: APC family permease [Megasphaera sp.]|jgi:APA family basic amino acid/polyamine antiporter|uniref:APC family permease n=1 Tax=Megasphaera sueciensis TaxID=349094 RepID=UPI003D0268C7|nr:APC family permease [Megasphaera sp.]MCI1822597.1 APC family permease [Megasphaera sp.]